MNKKNKILVYVFIFLLSSTLLIWFYLIQNNTKKFFSFDTDTTISENDNVDLSYNNSEQKMDLSITNRNRFENIKTTTKDIGIPILYYHSVNENVDNEITISPETLKEQLYYINNEGYTTITISEFYDYLQNKQPIPEKSIIITFDDGYMNNYTEAFPILKELHMKATIFCVGNSLDGTYYLSKEAIKEMSDYGIDIESHTVNHLHLDTLTYDEQLSELKNSKEILENITGKTILSLAYPFGDYNDDTIKAAKEAGYKMAFTTNLGLSDKSDGLYELDRIYISSYYDMNVFKDLLKNTEK